jgi:protein involved in polysaccharide export with SLBB domain
MIKGFWATVNRLSRLWVARLCFSEQFPVFKRGRGMRQFWRNVLIAACLWASMPHLAVAAETAPMPAPVSDTANTFDNYVLGPSDKVKISIYGEEALSGEYVISSDGNISLPLTGNVRAAGLTVKQFQEQLVQTYREGYLKDPKITAEVQSARPFFILGEVKTPGQYPCSNGMTALNAVATAGGFTYRANTDDIYIRHANQTEEAKVKLSPTVTVMPGDTIRISERWF